MTEQTNTYAEQTLSIRLLLPNINGEEAVMRLESAGAELTEQATDLLRSYEYRDSGKGIVNITAFSTLLAAHSYGMPSMGCISDQATYLKLGRLNLDVIVPLWEWFMTTNTPEVGVLVVPHLPFEELALRSKKDKDTTILGVTKKGIMHLDGGLGISWRPSCRFAYLNSQEALPDFEKENKAA